jgi:hypothetical protein
LPWPVFATAKPLRRLDVFLAAGFTVLTFALLASSTTGRVIDRTTGWAAAALIVAIAGWAFVAAKVSTSRALTAAAAVAGLLAVANAGWFVQRDYLRHRYTASDPRSQLAHLVTPIRHARIGVAGFPMEYPFYGLRLDNEVDAVGTETARHGFNPPRTCGRWRKALRAKHYQYVVIEPDASFDIKPLVAWTASIPGTQVVVTNATATVIRLPAHIRACPVDQSASS